MLHATGPALLVDHARGPVTSPRPSAAGATWFVVVAAFVALLAVDAGRFAWLSSAEILGAILSVAAVATAARGLVALHRKQVGAAILEERRRVARELHDGVANELAFLVTRAQLVALAHPEVDGLPELESTARRALDEARLAIAAMTRQSDETLDAAIAAAAEEVAWREGATVHLRLDRGITVPADVRDSMARIVREAVANAIRHGDAKELTVVLSQGDGIRLEVIDDGRGFDPGRPRVGGGGFGLVSMSERARALGGALRVTSRPGAGTRVEVEVA